MIPINTMHRRPAASTLFAAGLFIGIFFFVPGTSGHDGPKPAELFATSDKCQSCHNQLGMDRGEDLSIGTAWRGTLMAHSAVDPYWRAGVRREIMDHPSAADAIEDECATCHKPMQRFVNQLLGGQGRVFQNRDEPTMGIGRANGPLALDGVSCTLCHQIGSDNLGAKESFTGGFQVDTATHDGERKIHGPYAVATATKRVMRSATRFEPNEAYHIQDAAFCASCHTLYTHSLDDDGNDIGAFPEQVPYLEWQHSKYSQQGPDAKTCQDCHMATARRDAPISSVLGKPRAEVSQHAFRGGNFLMLHLIGQNSPQVGARASAGELDLSGQRTRSHLDSSAAKIEIDRTTMGLSDTQLSVVINVTNLAGHKLPTAYPSRRVWIQLVAKDNQGNAIFESGYLEADGAIKHNDNDTDPLRFEPHHEQITSPEQVQIYEAIMGKPDGSVTTGLLTATQYLKDNRVLPAGFSTSNALPDVAVWGAADKDATFRGGGDSTVYSIGVDPAVCPCEVTARLWYQPIGHRWAKNLAPYDAAEPKAFLHMYEAIDGRDTAVVLAQDAAIVTPSAPVSADTVVIAEP
ncbi:MAG: hypothetical protein QNJ97_15935 [Myxococcota bacterium]|nr:hypothetical protein [Myxococcota bacterium]